MILPVLSSKAAGGTPDGESRVRESGLVLEKVDHAGPPAGNEGVEVTSTAAPTLVKAFTSTGSKFFAHQEAMKNLRNGQGQPIVTHLMPTDVCNHTCAFCSVQTRDGSVLKMSEMAAYLDILVGWGLKAVIISGGGNPILYRCPETKAGFNELVAMVHGKGLEIGVITNGMPLRTYEGGRRSWKTVSPQTLDLLTWLRISMSGLDHEENCVYVPDIDRRKTVLGFSYVYHDIYDEPDELNHGKVSRPEDLVQVRLGQKVQRGYDRAGELTDRIGEVVVNHNPRYVRLLPNCLEPNMIADRCGVLQRMADQIDPDVVFVQYKPPAAPHVCLLGYVHPVLNSDGFVYPCDSCVLNEAAGHKFNKPWRVCHWSEINKLYSQPIRSLVDPQKLCPGCVFTQSNRLLEEVAYGEQPLTSPTVTPEHVNFV